MANGNQIVQGSTVRYVSREERRVPEDRAEKRVQDKLQPRYTVTTVEGEGYVLLRDSVGRSFRCSAWRLTVVA